MNPASGVSADSEFSETNLTIVPCETKCARKRVLGGCAISVEPDQKAVCGFHVELMALANCAITRDFQSLFVRIDHESA